MKRIFVLLILVLLVLGAATSVYADGTDESQTPVLPEGIAPEPMQPEDAAQKAADPQPRGATRGYVRGRVHVCVPAPARKQGEWGQCPLCGSTSRAEQELAIWAKVTGVPAEELKKHLSSGVGLGDVCGAVVVARRQGKSLSQVIQQAKNDKVSMRVLAYAAGMSVEEFAKEVEALHTAFTDQAVADGLVPKGQVAKGREAPVPGRLTKPGLGSGGRRVIWLARVRDMMLMQLRNMMRVPVGTPDRGR